MQATIDISLAQALVPAQRGRSLGRELPRALLNFVKRAFRPYSFGKFSRRPEGLKQTVLDRLAAPDRGLPDEHDAAAGGVFKKFDRLRQQRVVLFRTGYFSQNAASTMTSGGCFAISAKVLMLSRSQLRVGFDGTPLALVRNSSVALLRPHKSSFPAGNCCAGSTGPEKPWEHLKQEEPRKKSGERPSRDNPIERGSSRRYHRWNSNYLRAADMR